MSVLNAHDYAVSVRSSSGQEARFSTTTDDPDELVRIENFSTASGTGFESMTMSFDRDPSNRYDDLDFLEDVVLEGPDGKRLFEGAITGRAPEAGRGLKINCTGHWSKLADKPGVVSDVIVDRDVTKWEPVSPARRANNMSAGFVTADGAAFGGGIKLALASLPWTNPGLPTTEIWYVAPPGAFLKKLSFDPVRTNTAWLIGAGDPFRLFGSLFKDDTPSSYDITPDQHTLGSPTVTLSATAADRRMAVLIAQYINAVGVSDSVERAIQCSNVVAYGTDLTSFTPSTILKFLIDKYAPGVRYDADSIQTHPYEIGQMVFENTSLSNAFAQLNAFANWTMAVWEDGTMFFQPAPDLTQADYIIDPAYRSPDSQTISDDYPVNGVQVNYTDALTGRPERLLPSDDYRLRSDDDENPCNKTGRSRWGKMDISFACTAADATQLGAVWLAEHLIPSRSGSAKVPGTVTTASGQEVPAQNMRSDEVARFADESFGRQIMKTNYETSSGGANTLTFTDGPATLDAILTRIGVKVSLIRA